MVVRPLRGRYTAQMIVGLGIDLADLDRIDRIYRKYGDHFLKRILAPEELAGMPKNAPSYLAGRFAGKEAAAKALGTGFSNGITPAMLMIINDASGKPSLVLQERARMQAMEIGARRFHISLSHERNYAVAIVILED